MTFHRTPMSAYEATALSQAARHSLTVAEDAVFADLVTAFTGEDFLLTNRFFNQLTGPRLGGAGIDARFGTWVMNEVNETVVR